MSEPPFIQYLPSQDKSNTSISEITAIPERDSIPESTTNQDNPQTVAAAAKIDSEQSPTLTHLPWVVVVNAPEHSLAHLSLIDLLNTTLHPVKKLILMGSAAAVARINHATGAAYVALSKILGCELLVCGMAAKNFGITKEQLNPEFKLTGFMEILSLMHAQTTVSAEAALAADNVIYSDLAEAKVTAATDLSDTSLTAADGDGARDGYRVITW